MPSLATLAGIAAGCTEPEIPRVGSGSITAPKRGHVEVRLPRDCGNSAKVRLVPGADLSTWTIGSRPRSWFWFFRSRVSRRMMVTRMHIIPPRRAVA